jgi:hypothetical protein
MEEQNQFMKKTTIFSMIWLAVDEYSAGVVAVAGFLIFSTKKNTSHTYGN